MNDKLRNILILGNPNAYGEPVQRCMGRCGLSRCVRFNYYK